MAVYVPNYKQLIKGIAFGDNSGELNNTCSAVAMSIALNYLAAEFDDRLVPAELRLGERRFGERHFGERRTKKCASSAEGQSGSSTSSAEGQSGNPTSSVNLSSSNPTSSAEGQSGNPTLPVSLSSSNPTLSAKGQSGSPASSVSLSSSNPTSSAERFHRYLIDQCGLGPTYHLKHLTWGVWGPRLKRGLARYLAAAPERQATGLNLHWQLGGTKRILQSIDAGLPALVTTFPGPVHDADGIKGYGWHTMVVYGYRMLENGKVQLCVHSGWLTSKTSRHHGLIEQDDIWISPRTVCFSYCFSFTRA